MAKSTAKLSKLFKKSIKNVFIYSVGLIVLLIGTPLLLFIFIPIVIYRRFLFHSVKFFRPDLGKMLNARGTIPAFENVYKSPRCKLVTAMVLEGVPALQDIYDGINSALEATDPKTGDILYPELTQNITKWMGHWFWKSVPSFNFKDYIEYIDNSAKPLTYEQADKLLKLETSVPFQEDKALWKLTLYTNYIPHEGDKYFDGNSRYSFLVFCVHHSLVDGFSLVKLAHKIFQITYTDPTVVHPIREAFSKRATKALKFCGRIPYDLGKLMMEQTIPKSIWKAEAVDDYRECKSVLTEEAEQINLSNVKYVGLASEMIPFEKVKDIRKIHNVTSLSVIIAAIAGSIRCNFFKQSSKIPSKIPFSLPFPLQNHPDKLRNHVTGLALSLPVGEKDPVKRLHKINRTLKELKTSTVPFLMALLGVLVGSFPPALLKIFAKSAEQSHIGFLSSFPGPPEEIQVFNNCTWKDNFWVCSVMSGTKVLAFAFTTYAGYGRLLVGADHSVLPSDAKATGVINGFLNQLDILQTSKIDTV